MKVQVLDDIRAIGANQWNALFTAPGKQTNPFIRHAFLEALEVTGCACPDTGWAPRHLQVLAGGQTIAAMPMYLKAHSSGEFVFDWGWAAAYERHGLDYYPKLVTAAPFTPSVGPRIGILPGVDAAACIHALESAALALAERENASGWHLLFPDPDAVARINDTSSLELLRREDVQFHWRNRDYGSFDDFLATLKSSRRKNLRKERRRVSAQDVRLARVSGPDISDEDWAGFYRCYRATFESHSGHAGYMNRAFFNRLRDVMPEQLLLVTARRAGQLVASSLCLQDDDALYGRYWGALAEVDCLHFEACFYQGIEYCIEQGLRRFDPGAQGEHKLLRGFEPVTTRSFHWIADTRFRRAIDDYLARERPAARQYGEDAARLLPFREPPGDQGSGT